MSNLNLYTIINILNDSKEYIIINSYDNKYTIQEIIRNKQDIYLGETQFNIESNTISKIISFHNKKPNLFTNNKINQETIISKDNYLMDQDQDQDQDEYDVENKGINLEHLIEETQKETVENNETPSINDNFNQKLNQNTYNYTLIGGSAQVDPDEELILEPESSIIKSSPENKDITELDPDSEEENESSTNSSPDIDPEDSSEDEESSQESSSKTSTKELEALIKTPVKTPVKEEEESESDSDDEEEIILEDIQYEEDDDTILIYEENLIPDSKL
jgi:hypothetical protein